MTYDVKLDLHIHTNVSDGTDAPQEIVSRVRETGLDIFSVTDHDSVECAGIIPGLLTAGDPFFVPGVELSCKDEEGKYHILGYRYDPEGTAIRKVVEYGHWLRMKKTAARLDFLRDEFGFGFSEEERAKLLSLSNPGKPHIAGLMVARGYAETKEQAIVQYIDQLHFRDGYVRPEEAIAGILGSGGIPVLAHPSYGDGGQTILGNDMDRRLRRLTALGLRGVEAFYSGFTARLRDEMLGFAERYGLLVTAGSDYHGSNKPVRLGDTGFEGPEMPSGLIDFLEEIKKQK